MPFRYHDSVNFYDSEAIARAIRTQETNFQVIQNKISALVTESELEVLRNGGSTMYSRLASAEITVESLSTTISSLRKNLAENYSTTESMVSSINQKAEEITTSVSRTLQSYSTTEQMTQQMNAAIKVKTDAITESVSRTYVTKTDALTSVVIQFAAGTSNTTAPLSGWSTASTVWTAGRYIWTRTAITKNGNTTYSNVACIQGAAGQKGDAGDAGKGVKAMKAQYYLSTSKTTCSGGSWSDTPPTWSSGKYLWTRVHTTYTDNTTSTTNPVFDQINTDLEARMSKAELKITDNAIVSTVTSSTGISSIVSKINQSASTVQIEAAHINLRGSVTADDIAAGAITTDKLDAGAVTAAKIAANTITGNQIQAGSISAAELDVASIFAQDVTATGTITGAHLVGATCEIDSGSIGGWTLVDGVLTNPEYNVALTGEALHLIESHVSQMYIDMYEPAGMINFAVIPRISTNEENIANHETRIQTLEAATPSYPDNISCSTVTASGRVTCMELYTSGRIDSGGHTGSFGDLYTSGSPAGGSSAVIVSNGRVAPTSSSSRRYKIDKGYVSNGEAMKLLDLPVIKFQYKDGYLAKDAEMIGQTLSGFYAEDVEDLIPEAVFHKDGKAENWMERILIPLMLKIMQE